MPELPDITVYVEALTRQVAGQPIERVQIKSPFLLRSVEPPIAEAQGRVVRSVFRLGKRIVLDLGEDHFLVFHLMIAGRIKWTRRGAKAGPIGLAVFEFPSGSLMLTEAGTKRRASLHFVRGRGALQAMDRDDEGWGLELIAREAEAA